MNIKFQGIEYDREAKSFILCTYREYPVSRPPTVPWDVVDFLNRWHPFFHADYPIDFLASVREDGAPVSFFRTGSGAMSLEPFSLKMTLLCCMMSFYPRFSLIHYDPKEISPTEKTDAVCRWLNAALLPVSASLYDLILVCRNDLFSYRQSGRLDKLCAKKRNKALQWGDHTRKCGVFFLYTAFSALMKKYADKWIADNEIQNLPL